MSSFLKNKHTFLKESMQNDTKENKNNSFKANKSMFKSIELMRDKLK
jgi:hypothetical protein